jgi:hypothetical protein
MLRLAKGSPTGHDLVNQTKSKDVTKEGWDREDGM